MKHQTIPGLARRPRPPRRWPRLSQLSETVQLQGDAPGRIVYVKPFRPGWRGLDGARLLTRPRSVHTVGVAGRRTAQRSGRRLSRFLGLVVAEVQRAARRAGRAEPAQPLEGLMALITRAPHAPVTLGDLSGPTRALRRFVRSSASLGLRS